MKKLMIAVAVATLCGTAAAEGVEVKFSGFGTLGYVTTDNSDAEFRGSLRQSHGASTTGSFSPDSKLGLQSNVKFNDTFSAVGQVLTLNRDGSDKPNIEWLYGQASVAQGLDLRLGRMVVPAFLTSDSLTVGYSAYWLRAPRDVYDMYPIASFDGGQALYRFTTAGFNIQLQASAGKGESTAFNTGRPKAVFGSDKITAFALTGENGNWTFRVSKMIAYKLYSEFGGVRVGGEIRDAFTEAGVQYDNGNLIVIAEHVRRKDDGAGLFNASGAYLSSGYRIKTFTPFVNYSVWKPRGPTFAGYPDAKTKSAGVRWDVYKNIDLKFQFDQTSGSDRSINSTPAYRATAPKVNVYSVALDFVF